MESYEKKYKETLERAKEIKSKILYSHLSTESCKAVSEYIDTIIPELTESEDERVRKEIRNFLIDMECKEEWIAYLKNQKDYCGKTLIRDNGESACSYIERCLTPEMRKVWYEACAEIKEKQKEQPMPDSSKLIEMWEKEEAMLKERDLRGDTWRIAQNAFMDGFAKGTCVKFEQKAQKPSKYLDKDKVYAIMNKLTNLSYSQLIPINSDEYKKLYEITSDVRDLLDYPIEQMPADKDAAEPTPKQDYSKLNGLERAIHRGFLCAGVENVPVEIIKETAQDCITHIEHKPAEWSDVNDLIFRDICKHLKEEGYSGWVVLLETLRDGVFQFKQEWSEEDESNLQSCIAKIEIDMQHWDKDGNTMVDGDIKLIDWLKALPERFELQPKQEWDEKEEEAHITDNKTFFNWIYDRLLYVYKEDENVDYMRSFRERIESLFSKPH